MAASSNSIEYVFDSQGVVRNVSAMPEWDDTDYAPVAGAYADRRRADHEIAKQVHRALGATRTIINIGAGTGSYEPTDRYVVAVEPSPDMRARRPDDLPPALDCRAESLPFDDGAFEAALAVLTVHHWPDLVGGLREMRRVTSGPVVVLTADPAALGQLWLAAYAPEFHQAEARRYPALTDIATHLAGNVQVQPLRIPRNCTDGFADAFYGRPEMMLDRDTRRAQSAWSFVSDEAQEGFERRLSAALASGQWDAQHGHLRTQPEFEGSMKILVATP